MELPNYLNKPNRVDYVLFYMKIKNRGTRLIQGIPGNKIMKF